MLSVIGHGQACTHPRARAPDGSVCAAWNQTMGQVSPALSLRRIPLSAYAYGDHVTYHAPISPHVLYANPRSRMPYAATVLTHHSASPCAFSMRSPVLTHRMGLPPYARMPGTDAAYGAPCALCYLPTRVVCDVQY
eukprot:654062-Rhodomonas_salina.5